MKRFFPLILVLVLFGCFAALDVFKSEAAPGNAVKFNEEGWAYLSRGQYKRAVLSFKSALAQNSRYRDSLAGLAKAYRMTGVYDRALELYADALKVDRTYSEALTGSGLVLVELGRYKEALRFFEKAIEITGQDFEAHYGTAYLYYRIGRFVWAERKAETILRANPFHYETLLLYAALRSRDGRVRDAADIIQKAVDSKPERPDGYAALASIQFTDYIQSGSKSSLESARENIDRALSISPENYEAGIIAGDIAFYEGGYEAAAVLYKKAAEGVDGVRALYRYAAAADLSGNFDEAARVFLNAYKRYPSDSVLKTRIEHFLILRDYKIANPARNMFSSENFELARNRMKNSMPVEAVMYLRRTLMMNPMHMAARVELKNYYETYGYDRFYIDELKQLLNLYPGTERRDELQTAVMKRRGRMYHLEGFSADEVPRDVPHIIVMDLMPRGGMAEHPDAGEVLASHISFALGQFGRMDAAGFRERQPVRGISSSPEVLADSLEKIESLAKDGAIQRPDYILYGSYYENSGHISFNASLLDYSSGVVISSFEISETGREALPRASLRVAEKVYGMMPFRGRIIRQKDDYVIINLGLYDGIKPGDMLMIKKFNNPGNLYDVRRRILFTVKESDTLVSKAVPASAADLAEVDSSDYVYPLEKRRARRIR